MKNSKATVSCSSDVSKNGLEKHDLKKQVISIGQSDLPLSCPRSDSPLWSMHPRVFLPIEQSEDKKITCPYCSATYELK